MSFTKCLFGEKARAKRRRLSQERRMVKSARRISADDLRRKRRLYAGWQ